MKYAWINEQRDSFPVSVMCQVLKVSKSGYYDWIDRPLSPRAQRHQRILESVAQVHADSHGIYGSWKVAEELAKRDDLESVCRNTASAAMQELGLKSSVSKGFRPQTTQSDPAKQPAENTLNQDFKATAPNQKWVTDITYLWTDCGWVYLAVVIDLFSRKVVGWSLRDSLATTLVMDALRQAIELRRPEGSELLIHSDRGCQYTSDCYQQVLKTMSITCSMSRTGNCYDNAIAERFFWSLKQEWTNHHEYADLDAARLSVFKYIELFYNRQRLHQSLGYKSPEEFETEHAPVVAA